MLLQYSEASFNSNSSSVSAYVLLQTSTLTHPLAVSAYVLLHEVAGVLQLPQTLRKCLFVLTDADAYTTSCSKILYALITFATYNK